MSDDRMTLDYAPPPKFSWPTGRVAILGVLIAWTVAYAIVCVPAMGQRGYPPLESHLQGLTLCWIGAIPITALIEKWSKSRLFILLGYAGVTGFIDAASWPTMVPNRFNPGVTIFMTLIVFWPLHLLVAAIVELVSRAIMSGICKIKAGKAAGRVGRVVGAILLLVGCIFLPSAYASYDHWSLARAGIKFADEDWAAHRASIFTSEDSMYEMVRSDIRLERHFDELTGLPLNLNFQNGWETAYNQRVAELLRSSGKPAWCAPQIPSPADFATRLDSGNFTVVTTFPSGITPDIVVFHGGTIRKWGGSVSSGDPGLAIATSAGRLFGVSSNRKPTYISRDPHFPGVVFIRDGHEWLGAFAEDGRFIAAVSKD